MQEIDADRRVATTVRATSLNTSSEVAAMVAAAASGPWWRQLPPHYKKEKNQRIPVFSARPIARGTDTDGLL